MAQFRSTADIMDLALQNAGEVTNGNSSYETELLGKLNRVHFALVAGGTIPLGKDQTAEIDESWPWARSKKPLVLTLQPKIDTGSVSLTLNSESGTFSSAPTVSVAGWYLKVSGQEGLYRIASHTASSTAFELDSDWPLASLTGSSFKVVKLDYDLIPDSIVIDSTNNKIQFQEAAGTTLTATLTSGNYSPSELATEIQTQLNATGGTPAYTISYSAVTRKFTLASDRAGGAVFILVGTGDQSKFSAHKTIGFDDENTTNAASVTSTYALGGIARLIEPFKAHRGENQLIFADDPESLTKNSPITDIEEGTPSRFSIIGEDEDGKITVRFNKYPNEQTRIEIDYVPIPRDLKDNSSSVPLVPRKHIDVLEDAATFYIMLLKNDDRAMAYANLVMGKLKAMINQHRGSQLRAGERFGQIIPRRDLVGGTRRGLFPREPY